MLGLTSVISRVIPIVTYQEISFRGKFGIYLAQYYYQEVDMIEFGTNSRKFSLDRVE